MGVLLLKRNTKTSPPTLQKPFFDGTFHPPEFLCPKHGIAPRLGMMPCIKAAVPVGLPVRQAFLVNRPTLGKHPKGDAAKLLRWFGLVCVFCFVCFLCLVFFGVG